MVTKVIRLLRSWGAQGHAVAKVMGFPESCSYQGYGIPRVMQLPRLWDSQSHAVTKVMGFPGSCSYQGYGILRLVYSSLKLGYRVGLVSVNCIKVVNNLSCRKCYFIKLSDFFTANVDTYIPVYVMDQYVRKTRAFLVFIQDKPMYSDNVVMILIVCFVISVIFRSKLWVAEIITYNMKDIMLALQYLVILLLHLLLGQSNVFV